MQKPRTWQRPAKLSVVAHDFTLRRPDTNVLIARFYETASQGTQILLHSILQNLKKS